jgi:hypothetical protein
MWLGAPIVLGVAVRLLTYASDRSTSLDESLVGLNILRRGPVGLVGRLDWNSGAPIGFLEAEKAVTALFGGSEAALRLIPFLASVGALVLVAAVARQLLNPLARCVAVGLIAVLPVVVDYAGIAKQYSVDVAVMAGMLLLAIWALRLPFTAIKAWSLGLAILLSPLLSHPGIAMAVSAVIVIALAHLREPEVRPTRYVGGLVAGCLLVGALTGFLYERNLHGVARSLASGDNGETGFDTLRLFAGAVRAVMGVGPWSSAMTWPVGVVAALAAFGFYAAGLAEISRRRWQQSLLLVLPIALTVAAALLAIYPAQVRTSVFVAPLVVIPVANGMVLGARFRNRAVRLTAIAAAALVISVPVYGVVQQTRRVVVDDRMRTAMTFLRKHERPGDHVYLWQTSQYPFAFQLECRCSDTTRTTRERSFWPVHIVAGTSAQWAPAIASDNRFFVIGPYREPREQSFKADINRLRGESRVWIVLSALSNDERQKLVNDLDSIGRRIGGYAPSTDYEAATVSLYDLR